MLLDVESRPSVKRRTRVNVHQSKYGCFTCRARRVKCDETKPACLRCQRASRVCEGFPQGAPSTLPTAEKDDEGEEEEEEDALIPARSPVIVRYPGFGHCHGLDRLRVLACTVLSQGVPGARTRPESVFWNSLVPQLAYSIPSVKEAAAAFGASYEHQMLKRQSTAARLTATRQIAAAISRIREDVVRLPHGPLPILIACVLLACAETLQYRHTDALLHLRGAFSVMAMREQQDSSTVNCKALMDDDISILFQKLDLQVLSYALGEGSSLPFLLAEPPTESVTTVSRQDNADWSLFRAMHSCYNFTARASHFKYLPRAAARPELALEQSRHIAELTKWLSQYPPTKGTSLNAPSTSSRLHELVLRAHCLSALIYVSNILDPYETSYDKYASHFRQIIECIEETMRAGPTGAHLPTFNAEMGVIQPLFFTALKYRDSIWRSQAISLLHKCGREGPWCGYVEATAAECVARSEASAALELAMSPLDEQPEKILPEDIPEGARISGCSLYDVLMESSVAKWATFQLSRCRDVKAMLESSGEPPADARHWLMWQETYELPLAN